MDYLILHDAGNAFLVALAVLVLVHYVQYRLFLQFKKYRKEKDQYFKVTEYKPFSLLDGKLDLFPKLIKEPSRYPKIKSVLIKYNIVVVIYWIALLFLIYVILSFMF